MGMMSGGPANLRSPCGFDAPISDDYQEHRARGSAEPGTDYAVGVGTPVHAANPGRVSAINTRPTGAPGRFVRLHLDDGRVVRYLHLSHVSVRVGDRVGRGTVVGLSGGSGFGQEHHYGAHVHTSLWAHEGMPYAATIDFHAHVGHEEDEMPISDADAKKIAQAVWGYSMHGGDPLKPGDKQVPQESAGERLRQVRRSTDNLRHRTIDIEAKVDALADEKEG